MAIVGLNKIPMRKMIGLSKIKFEKMFKKLRYIKAVGRISFCPQIELVKSEIGLKIIKLKISNDLRKDVFFEK